MKKTVASVLLAALLANTFLGMMSIGASTEITSETEDEELFFSSFELNEDNSPLFSTPDGEFFSGLELVQETSNSDGLAIDLSTVGGSSDFKSEEGKLCLFDGKTDTKFLTENTTAEVFFKLEKRAVISSFMIASANDDSSRDPKNVVLYGSADGNDWKILSTATLSFPDRYQKKTVNFENTEVYAWYKLAVTQNNGSSNMTQFSELALYGETIESGDEEEKVIGNSPMSTLVGNGPSSTWCNFASVGWTGFKALSVISKKTAKNAYARNIIYDELNIPVSGTSKLSYVIFPGLKNTDYDYYYTSMHMVIDLKFSDGTYLSSLGAYDHNGMQYTPEGQAHGEALYTMQWNYVEVDLAKVAQGKTIEQILVYFNMEDGESRTQFASYFDDIKIENKADVTYEHLSDYIDIRRGTNDTSSFSRGLATPGVVTPNGANFYTPVTDPGNRQVPYKYQLAGSNNTLDSISIMHVPSNWVGSWGTWQFMANTSVDTNAGSDSVQASDITSDKRKAQFSHANETAKAHYYSVTFDEGSAASGVKMEVTPTSHGMYARFTFPQNSKNVNLIFDCLWGSSTVSFNSDGSFIATSNHTSGGSSRMYVYGVIDNDMASYKSFNDGSAIISFAEGTTEVSMKLATSYLSSAQAKHNLELEIADESFDEVFEKAQKAWDDICSVIEIEGATYTELVTFYSCMYRLYAYPTLYSENEGTNEEEKWVYASPYNNGKKTSGKMYVTNGFWDTYRTTWAAYGLLTPALDGELLDGFVQHYIDQGWVPRWVAPGGMNSMVGTSSDVIFADAYVKGLNFNFESAYKSMLKNASVVSQDLTNGGRAETETSVFKGYVSNSTANGFSWTVEGFINDFGLYVMSEKLGKTDEAEYYYNRCLKYVELYNSEAGFFMGKNQGGIWSSSASSFNPAGWWGDYTEASGWIMAFTTVYDGNGLANIFGGKEALADKLDAFFDDSVEAMKKVTKGTIHEEREAREVRMGQYAHNNQPSHHITYMYAFTDEQYKTQQLVRTALKKLYVGSEIGQGYCGDEDNGEMSAWYIFSSIGFYPLSMGSGEYVIGSPLFDKVTVHLENGKDITVTAINNSDENVYIQSCTVDGKGYNSLSLTHESLSDGADIVFEMGGQPSNWGSGSYEKANNIPFKAPSSLTNGTEIAKPLSDVVADRVKFGTELDKLSEKGTLYSKDIRDVQGLFDNTSSTSVSFKSGDSLVFASSMPRKVSIVTLTSSTGTRTVSALKVEASNDGENWKTLDERNDIEFEWKQYTRPFAIPEENRGMYCYYRLTFEGNSTNVSLAEVELLGVQGNKEDITPIVVSPVTGDTDETKKPEKNNSGIIYVVIAAAALVVIVRTVSTVIVAVKKKKKA